MADIELRNLSKHFGTLAAVDDIDLDVEAGEVVCLLGPSGCGKTTTLRMIAGLEEATAGEIFIAGARVNDLAPRDRDIAMVFQFYALYPSLTVAENLAFRSTPSASPRRKSTAGCARSRTFSISPMRWTGFRAGLRRARSSASPWGARSSATRSASSSTSR